MRDSFLILASFILGALLGRINLLPAFLADSQTSLWALWLFMFLAGVSVGADKKLPEILRAVKPDVLLLPLATTGGTFMGAFIAACFLAYTAADCLAVGAGFGYYSLSSIFIGQYKGPDLGAVALIANILRELFTLLLAPLIMRFCGPWGLISSGGCTTMDTTLPVIARYAGREWIIPAIIHAMVLDFSVPFWVALFCSV